MNQLREKLTEKSNNTNWPVLNYIVGAVICVILLVLVMNLWKADLQIPFSYSGDTLETSARIKLFTEDSGYLINSRIGAPFETNLADFPYFDNVSFVIFKILSLFFNDFGTILNIYFVLTFPLTTVASLLVFKTLRLSYAPSLVGALLFTFLPYHFLRGESHLFLATYYLVPLMILVFIWVASGEIKFFKPDSLKTRKFYQDKKLRYSIIICILIASSTTYYVYFSLFLLIISELYNLSHTKDIQSSIKLFLLLSLVIFVALIINLYPIILSDITNGHNSQGTHRRIGDPEFYGMKIVQLVIPLTEHRVTFLRNIKKDYNEHSPLITENDTSTLGFIGVIGFIILIFNIFLLGSHQDSFKLGEKREIINILSILSLFTILFGTIGGFGSITSLFLNFFRGYNRISVFTAFFAILLIVVLLDNWSKKISHRRGKMIFYSMLIVILITGILDQTRLKFIPEYKSINMEFENDHDFISKIETNVPPSSKIFQLPFNHYADSAFYKMSEYDLFKGYLQSKKLKWSYGSMQGRYPDYWSSRISSLSLDELLPAISFVGFQGVYVDTYGYADNGVLIVSQLKNITHMEPIVSSNQRLYYFDLNTYQQQLKKTYSVEEWETEKQKILNIPWFKWEGCYPLELDERNNWRWCTQKASLSIVNPSDLPINVSLKMSFQTNYPELSNLSSPLFNKTLNINSSEHYYSMNLTVREGESTTIPLESDAKKVNVPSDERVMVFLVKNFEYNDST